MVPALIGAAASIGSAVLGQRATASANEAARQNQMAATYWDNFAQDKAMRFNETEAQRAREFNEAEAFRGREFSNWQGALEREFNMAEAGKARDFAADQAVIGREFNSAEAAKARGFAERMQDEAQKFSQASSREQMAFQERMRGTQYQTAMDDMRKAGLNPMLAYSQGGAGTPSGSAAHSSAASAAAASAGSASGPAASSGRGSAGNASASPASVGTGGSHGSAPVLRMPWPDLLSSAAQVANIARTEAETERMSAETENLKAEKIGPEGPKTWSMLEKKERAKLLTVQQEREFEAAALSRESQHLVQEEVKNALEQRRNIVARTGNTEADTVLKRLAEAEARAGSSFWKANPGMYGIMQGLKAFGEGVSGAIGLRRLLTP